MANDVEEILDLRKRVEALEALVLTLRGRIEALEASDSVVVPDFHMGEQEPTI